MATHDYVIDNSTGANVRADINNVLAAIVSNNSGSSEPATKYAYQWWADTNTGTLKIRNSANNAWVELLQLDGTLTMEDGSASTPGLAFRNDLNTGLARGGADILNLVAGGDARLKLGATTIFNDSGADVDFRIEGDTDANAFAVDASTNYVGVGIATPAQKFHVYGNSGVTSIAVGDNTTTQPYMLLEANETDNVCTIHSRTDNALTFKIATSEKARFDSSGNLLIGKTGTAFNTDGIRLDGTGIGVFSSSSTSTILASGSGGNVSLSNPSNTDNNFSCIGGYNSNSLVTSQIDFVNVSQSNRHGAIAFLVHNGSSMPEMMRITKDGNVGIGTTNPTVRLYINGGSGGGGVAEILRLDTTGNSNGDGSKIAFSRAGTVRTEISSIKNETSNNETDIAFSTTKLGSLGEKMRIDSSGNVSIGSTTNGGANRINLVNNESGDFVNGSDAALRITNENGSNDTRQASIAFTVATTGVGSDGAIVCTSESAGNSNLRFFTDTSNGLSEKMRLTSSAVGKLFIGCTAEPTGGASGIMLQGNGFQAIGYAGSGSGNFIEFNNSNGNIGRINGNASTTSYITSSDYRLKENETAISDGITRLKTLKPYRFNFKTEPSVTQDGFFAHEVSSAVPIAVLGDKDATKEDGSIEPQGIDHSKLVPLLVAAVQELIGKVETLEAA